jgi:thioredoxin 1
MKRLFAGFSLLLIFACSAQTELPSASDAAVKEALASGRPVVIDLGARHCIPCKKMAPILEALANEYRGRAGVLFIDVNEDQAAALKFNVQMIPTQVFFDTRGREVKRHVGFMEKADILKELKKAGLK